MTLRLERQGAVAHLLIDRAEKRNAFNQAMWDLFPRLLTEAMDDPSIHVLVVRAAQAGSAFCAGADIGEFATGSGDPAWRAANQAAINRVQHELARAPKPTIAMVEGDCVGGGCGLALACDFRVAGPKARFEIRDWDVISRAAARGPGSARFTRCSSSRRISLSCSRTPSAPRSPSKSTRCSPSSSACTRRSRRSSRP